MKDFLVINNETHRAVIHLREAESVASRVALSRGWQGVLDVAGPQYPAERFVPNEKPQVVEDAIQREVWSHIGHLPHPDDPTGRTALCGIEIIGGYNATPDRLAICADCQALHAADDPAPPPE